MGYLLRNPFKSPAGALVIRLQDVQRGDARSHERLGHFDHLLASDVRHHAVSLHGPYILGRPVRAVDEIGRHRRVHHFSQPVVSCYVLRGHCIPALEVPEIGDLRHVIDVQAARTSPS